MLLREHGEALEASFQAEYGIDLLDLYRGELTPRKAAALAVNLPPGSAVWREYGGPQAWTDAMHLTAEVEHGVRVLAWQKTEDGRKRMNAPERLTPPPLRADVKAQEQAQLSKARRYIARQRAKAATTE